MATRTARLNTVRGLLREFGVVIPVGARQVVPHVRALLEDADAGIPGLLRPALAEAVTEIGELETRLRAVERQLETAAAESLVVGQLRTIPGIGLLTATALVAFVGDVQRFPSAGTSPATSGSRRGSPRRAAGGASAPSASAATAICACCSSTGRGPCCGTPSAERAAARSAAHLGAAARTAARSQQGRRRARQQAGAHRLGGVGAAQASQHFPSLTKGACEARSGQLTTTCCEDDDVMATRF